MLNMCCTSEQDANTMNGCIRVFSRDQVLIVMIILLHATRHDHGRPYSVEMLCMEGIVTVPLLPCSIIVIDSYLLNFCWKCNHATLYSDYVCMHAIECSCVLHSLECINLYCFCT